MTVIYENDNYKVEIGKGIDYEIDHYLITNKNTFIIEVETRLLPQAKLWADQLNMAYNMDIEDEQMSLNLSTFSH